jgi:AcrR family transcriptional regulator
MPAATTTRRKYAPRLPPEERREQLLDVALEIIAERGYAAVSIEAIAQGAGVSRPVVYGLFDDLHDLLSSLLAREERRALAQLATAVPSTLGDDDPDDVLVAGMRTFLEAVAADPLTWKVILFPLEGTPHQLRENVERNRELVLRQIERLVEWGVERRGGPVGLDVELFARMVVSLGEEAGRLVLTNPERFPPERHVALAERLLAALRRDES